VPPSLEFRDTAVTTKRITDDIAVDYDSEGAIAGVEILSAKKHVFQKSKDFAVEVGSLWSAKQTAQSPPATYPST
jgi:uncharacterized protein YuzE